MDLKVLKLKPAQRKHQQVVATQVKTLWGKWPNPQRQDARVDITYNLLYNKI